MLRIIAGLAILAGLAVSTLAGPLVPPPMPVAPTGKTLDEVEPSKPVNDANTPGTAVARFRISQPGSYHLTGDVFAGQDQAGILIAASGVTLDLRGFNINGLSLFVTSTLSGIQTDSPNVRSDITIRNGVIQNFSEHGISMPDAPRVTVEHVSLVGNGERGCWLGSDARISASRASGNSSDGFFATNAILEGCIARDNNDGFHADESVLRDCIAVGNNGRGFTGTESLLNRCLARDNANIGFVASRSVMRDCTAIGNLSFGFQGGELRASNCLAYNNQDDGFFVFGGEFSHCTSRSNAGDGFSFATTVSAVNCLALGNTDSGFRLAGRTILRNNEAYGNAIGFHVTTSLNTLVGNLASTNTVNWDVVSGNVCRVIRPAQNTGFSGDFGGVAPGGSLGEVNYTIEP